ncbi:alpha-1-antitrypsin homolog [Lepisosteus oculatus]|nr:PREDICTED: alpha-1-antitrypsin homolog [Lepisosteus oculatus]
MRLFLNAGVIAALLLCGVWAAPHHGNPEEHSYTKEHHDHLHHGNQETHEHKQCERSCNQLAPANADFAFALYKHLKSQSQKEAKNIFFSPLSISTALSMLSLGAKGATHDQIFQALGFSEAQVNETQVNEGFEHLYHMLGHSQEQLQLEAGNAVVTDDEFKPSHQFLTDAKHYYQTEGFTVDFHKPDEAKQTINNFIEKKTHGKIKDLIKDLDPGTVMVLLNYMFFKGKWEKPFEEKYTSKGDFHVSKDKTVSVDMMKRTGRYLFYYDQQNSTSVLMLPYRGNASMMVVLPDEGKMETVEEFISKDDIKRWHDSLFRSSLDVEMPKYSVSASYSLKEILIEMGIVNVFGQHADLSGISEVPLKVSKVAHRAVLSVDERGTEAAAATGIDVMPMSMPFSMVINRPFILLILEETTESILFMGKITDPTAQ